MRDSPEPDHEAWATVPTVLNQWSISDCGTTTASSAQSKKLMARKRLIA
jgi:hypothetical protein